MIKVIADSTCDFPQELVERYGIQIVPLKVSIAGKTYDDKSEINTVKLFDLIKLNNEMSVTAAPSPEQYRVAMQKAVDEGHSVIVCTISSALSGSYQSACVAAEMVDGVVDVVDTRTASTGSGLIVMDALRLAEEGVPHKEVVAYCRQHVSKQRTLILLDTVEFLRRGGRVGAVSARMASMLGIKPIISVIKDGSNIVIHKARSYKKGMEWILNVIKETARDIKNQTVGIGYSSSEEPAKQFADMMRKALHPKEILMEMLGCVVGTHIGPYAFGVFWEEV